MGILSRCRDILASNVNAMLDKAEDPEKLVDQYLLDARKDLAECKEETAEVMAAEKEAKRMLDNCKENIEKYEAAAVKAVQAGNDEDAKRLMKTKWRYEAQLEQLTKNYESAAESSENMRKIYEKLTEDIQTLESRKSIIKSTAATAKAQEKANKFSGKSDYGKEALEGLARMEQKANERLDKATSAAELDEAEETAEDLLNKYSSGADRDLDEELAKIKAKLAGKD